MASTILLAAAAMLLLLAAHPFITYPLSLRLLARRKRPLAHCAPPPRSAALCVCAYNEEQVIRAKAENMLALQDSTPGLELLIYVDAATDQTVELLRPYADRIHLLVSPVRHGKTHGMNCLVARTSAEIVVFSDANVMFAPDAVRRLMLPFRDSNVGGVCGHLVYTSVLDSRAASADAGSRYWRLEERIKALESECGSVMGADGSIFAIRRALHRPPPPDLIDDMYVSLSVVCGGSRLVRAADAIAYETPVSRPGEEFRRKVRIACQAFNVHRALAWQLHRLPPIEQYKYISHKLLRWLVIYLLAASTLCGLTGLALLSWTAAAVAVCGATLAAAALLAASRGPVAGLREVFAAFIATGIGVWRSLCGDRFQIWTPPASARQPVDNLAALQEAKG